MCHSSPLVKIDPSLSLYYHLCITLQEQCPRVRRTTDSPRNRAPPALPLPINTPCSWSPNSSTSSSLRGRPRRGRRGRLRRRSSRSTRRRLNIASSCIPISRKINRIAKWRGETKSAMRIGGKGGRQGGCLR